MSKPQKRPYKVAAAGCVVYRRTAGSLEFLLAKRPGSKWMLPRGKIQQGENPRTAAAREVFEETGVRARAGLEVGSYSYPIGKGRYKFVQFFASIPISGSPTPDGREFSEVDWVEYATAVAAVSPRESVLLESVAALCEEKVLP
jgi:8-oxo-dGTP pyrophosphatase MutT (NUDIX family)